MVFSHLAPGPCTFWLDPPVMTPTPSELRWGKKKSLLPCLVSPVPSQGGEAGAGVGEWGLRGGVVNPVTVQLQVRPVDQVGSRSLVLLIVHIEALSWGASGGALGKDAVDGLIERELFGVRACAQELIGDGVG